MKTEGKRPHSNTNGLVLHWAAQYDFLVWLVMRSKERAFREKLIQAAHLKPGERVLDVGCGTGTLAIAAKRRFGASSAVSGIDASPEMIARAKKKAVNAGVEIDLQVAICEALPFQTGSFDVAFSTMMLHHLGAKARRECANEIRRVLTPGGRWFVVDFEGPARHAGGILSLFHRHGHIKPGALSALVSEAGLNLIDKGPLGFRNLHFVLAESPGLHIGEK